MTYTYTDKNSDSIKKDLKKGYLIAETPESKMYKITFAGKASSGPSFGYLQIDIGQQDTYKNLLLTALKSYKPKGFSSDVIKKIEESFTKKGSALKLSDDEVEFINSWMSLNKSKIDEWCNKLTTDYFKVVKDTAEKFDPENKSNLFNTNAGLCLFVEFLNQMNPGGAYIQAWLNNDNSKYANGKRKDGITYKEIIRFKGSLSIADFLIFLYQQGYSVTNPNVQLHNTAGMLSASKYVPSSVEECEKLIFFFQKFVTPNYKKISKGALTEITPVLGPLLSTAQQV